MKLLTLQNVSLYYKNSFSFFSKDKKLAIENLSIDINSGEKIGLIGKNGSGKTSFLKVLAGIYKPDKGSLVINKPYRPVFIGLQSGFVPYLSGEQNIWLTGLLIGMSKAEIKEKISSIINYTELGSSINKPLYTYSSGMKARLAFSVSLHSAPDLLLLDEVMGVGDKDFKEKSSKSLRSLIQSNMSVVIVSHDVRYLREMTDTCILFDAGKVKNIGSTQSVINKYITKSSCDS